MNLCVGVSYLNCYCCSVTAEVFGVTQYSNKPKQCLQLRERIQYVLKVLVRRLTEHSPTWPASCTWIIYEATQDRRDSLWSNADLAGLPTSPLSWESCPSPYWVWCHNSIWIHFFKAESLFPSWQTFHPFYLDTGEDSAHMSLNLTWGGIVIRTPTSR